VAGAFVVAAGAALGVTTLLPTGHSGLLGTSHPGLLASGHPAVRASGHPSSHPASVRLTAWTVARQANGDIDVTINQLQNPAGLQATLRADGLPVNVTFSGSLLNASCQPYPGATLNAVTQIHGDEMVIDPAALPSGVGLAIFDEPGAGVPVPSGTPPTLGPPPAVRPTIPPLLTALNGPLAVGLVYASPQCTG
jgi:hypothetical protein